jgi:hypothetical protein
LNGWGFLLILLNLLKGSNKTQQLFQRVEPYSLKGSNSFVEMLKEIQQEKK